MSLKEFQIERHPGKDDGPVCKGKIYRARVSMFITQRGEYVYRERMVPIKGLSCEGCAYCEYMEEHLKEATGEEYGAIIKDIEDQALYKLGVTNVQTDWETGYVDSWDMEFIKLTKDELLALKESIGNKRIYIPGV